MSALLTQGKRADPDSPPEDLGRANPQWGDQVKRRESLRSADSSLCSGLPNKAKGANNDDEEFNDEEISDSG
jgi:hypothetical protein